MAALTKCSRIANAKPLFLHTTRHNDAQRGRLLRQLCRGGYFLLHNREQPSPRSLINIKKYAVQRGEDISKKNDEMSYNFGEIIKKLYFLVSRKPVRGLPMPSPPPLRQPLPHIFQVVDGKVWFGSATFTRGIHSREGRGEGGVICETMPFDNGSSY